MSNIGIYLDHQASTPVDPRVLESMAPYFTEIYANPHVTSHQHALRSSKAVELARAEVAQSIGANDEEIVFTSGATEANNLVILGTQLSRRSRRRVIVAQTTEHASVLESIKERQRRDSESVILNVTRDGVVDIEELKAVLSDSVAMVSIMLVNNETGVIQPVREITDLCHRVGALVHSDCAQALGRVTVDVNALGVDFASFSGHKVYGPKGIGALYIRQEARNRLQPIMFGGGQEGGLRPGTLPVPLCVGFGHAAKLANVELNEYRTNAADQLRRLKKFFSEAGFKVSYNGKPEQVVPGCMSATFAQATSNYLIDQWSSLELSTGSACEVSRLKSSHVLRAMKLSRAKTSSTIRFSVGRFTTESDMREIQRTISKRSSCINSTEIGV